MARHKVEWPIARHTVPKPNFNHGPGLLVDLFLAHDRSTGPLWDEFTARAKQIDEDATLTELGKQRARTKLVTELREGDNLKRHIGVVEKGRARITELRSQMTARHVPKNLSPYEQVSLAHQQDRAVRRYETLQPDQQRAVLRRAEEARDRNFLEPLYREPGLLNERDAARIEAILLEGSNRDEFKELQELAGKFDLNGEPDPTTSAVACADFSVGSLLDEMDKWASLDRPTEEARAIFNKQLEVKDAPLVLTNAQGHDPRIYQAAKALAAQHGRVLSINGPDGDSEGGGTMAPSATGNGDGGAGTGQ
jgi:hypothetical protein